MLQKVEKKEHNQVELEFTVSKEVFDAACTRAFKKNAPKMNVPGFRRGKAPRHIIEKMYGTGVFYDEALNDVLPDAYTAAVDEAKLEVVSRPEFDVLSIDENGVVFKAVLYVMPEVSLSSYKGLSAEKTIKKATEADVDAELDRVRSRNSRQIDVTDRPVAKDDTAVIDFEGFIDGVAFDGGKGEDYSLKIGSGSFIPGFEDQIIGHSVGESFDVNVTFPADYGKDDLAGKEAVFKVTVKGIKFTELPELDDEFAKDVSEFDTLAEYKADIEAKLNERYEKSAESAVEEQLIDGLIDNLEADIPDAMYDTEVENVIRDRDFQLRSQGLSLDMYMKYTGMDLDGMRAQAKPQAIRQVKTRLALDKIIELEGITASEEDLATEYQKLADAYTMELDEVKKRLPADALSKDICTRKAVDLIRAEAVITEKTEEEKAEEPAQAE